jgi:hypothetical protein
MLLSDWIGFAGVSILLVAFLLNLLGKLPVSTPAYSFLNFLGAGLACLASVMINYIPFVILEGVWTAVSFFSLIKNLGSKSR